MYINGAPQMHKPLSQSVRGGSSSWRRPSPCTDKQGLSARSRSGIQSKTHQLSNPSITTWSAAPVQQCGECPAHHSTATAAVSGLTSHVVPSTGHSNPHHRTPLLRKQRLGLITIYQKQQHTRPQGQVRSRLHGTPTSES
jgi:hypothetical protein